MCNPSSGADAIHFDRRTGSEYVGIRNSSTTEKWGTCSIVTDREYGNTEGLKGAWVYIVAPEDKKTLCVLIEYNFKTGVSLERVAGTRYGSGGIKLSSSTSAVHGFRETSCLLHGKSSLTQIIVWEHE